MSIQGISFIYTLNIIIYTKIYFRIGRMIKKFMNLNKKRDLRHEVERQNDEQSSQKEYV